MHLKNTNRKNCARKHRSEFPKIYARACPSEPRARDARRSMHELNADVLRLFRANMAASARANSAQESVREMQRLAARHAELVRALQRLRMETARRQDEA